MIEFQTDDFSYGWFCIWGHRGGGYTTADEAQQAELGHECYGGAS